MCVCRACDGQPNKSRLLSYWFHYFPTYTHIHTYIHMYSYVYASFESMRKGSNESICISTCTGFSRNVPMLFRLYHSRIDIDMRIIFTAKSVKRVFSSRRTVECIRDKILECCGIFIFDLHKFVPSSSKKC